MLSKSEAVQAVLSSAALQLISLSKVYGSGASAVNALEDVTLTFPKATFTAVMGPSGSGKSTLLNCAAGLDRATSGHVLIGDIDLMQLNDKQLTLMRRRRVGFVFQSLNLLPALTAEQNILLPLRLAGRPTGPEREWLHELVERMGIAGRIHYRPAKMSIGQQQLVAIARALIAHPGVVFADEPTGALGHEVQRGGAVAPARCRGRATADGGGGHARPDARGPRRPRRVPSRRPDRRRHGGTHRRAHRGPPDAAGRLAPCCNWSSRQFDSGWSASSGRSWPARSP